MNIGKTLRATIKGNLNSTTWSYAAPSMVRHLIFNPILVNMENIVWAPVCEYTMYNYEYR